MDSKKKETINLKLGHSDEVHNHNCRKQPSDCSCVDWIRASSSIIPVKSVRPGMWTLSLYFEDKKCIDEIWKKIKILLSDNQLGNLARVSTYKEGLNPLINVFTYDFEDVQDVFRVLVTLQRNQIEKGYFCDFEYVTLEPFDIMYYSPPMRPAGPKTKFREYIYMFKDNGESEDGLVAKLKKNSTNYSKDIKIKFYNPPMQSFYSSQFLPCKYDELVDVDDCREKPSAYSSQSRPCKYDELVDKEDNLHEPDCDKEPSTCYCKNVTWIWAAKPVQVKPIRSGQWLLFPEKKNVDEVWEKVKILIAANRLGNGAKVSKARRSKDGWDDHVICVNVSDAEDVEDLFRVLVTLRRNRLQDAFINFVTSHATLQKMFKTDKSALQSRHVFSSLNKFEGGLKFFLYFSPPNSADSDPTGEREMIQLFKNNIDTEFKRSLVTIVAQLKKEPGDFEANKVFYNPPRILVRSDHMTGF